MRPDWYLDEARRSMIMEAFVLGGSANDMAELRSGGNPFVGGEGPMPCRLMMIGEAPGEDEARMRRPFVGRSGRLLDELMKDAGILRRQTYITNVVKYRPSGNRNPTDGEIEAFKPLLRAEIKAVDPKVICLIGAIALQTVFPDLRVSRVHGKVIPYRKRKWVPIYHPSYVLRRRDLIPAADADMRTIKELLK